MTITPTKRARYEGKVAGWTKALVERRPVAIWVDRVSGECVLGVEAGPHEAFRGRVNWSKYVFAPPYPDCTRVIYVCTVEGAERWLRDMEKRRKKR